jgi:hypothetical protein
MTTSSTSSARHFAQLSCHAMRRPPPVNGRLSTTFFAPTHASLLASPKIPCTIVLGRPRVRAGSAYLGGLQMVSLGARSVHQRPWAAVPNKPAETIRSPGVDRRRPF